MTQPTPRPSPLVPVVVEALAATAFLLLATLPMGTRGRLTALGLAVAVFGFANLHVPRGAAGAVARDGALVFEAARWREVVFAGSELVGVAALAAFFAWPWWLAFVAAYLIFTIFVSSHRLCREVSLHEDGVTVRTLRSAFTVSWHEAARLTMRGRTQLLVPHESRVRWLSVELLGAEPYTVYRTVHYYAMHPDARDELGDGRGIARARREPVLEPLPV